MNLLAWYRNKKGDTIKEKRSACQYCGRVVKQVDFVQLFTALSITFLENYDES